MAKIALALIVKGTDEEAAFLNNCIENVAPHVDGIFITATYPRVDKNMAGIFEDGNSEIERIVKAYNGKLSNFEWCNDFAAARNFNFSQVPKDYDYILWCDADDMFRGLEQLRTIIEQNPSVDAFAFNYLYDFDKYKNPVIVHKKTQVVRNDGCVEWVGKLHEDFKENRQLNVQFVSSIERMHMTTEEHVKSAQLRNIEISSEEAKLNPNDPRVYFNLGNSYFGVGKFKEAKTAYNKFLATSQSYQEKYLVYQRISAVEKALGNKDKAIEYLFISLGMSPELPESYNLLGYLFFEYNMLDMAEKYLMMGLVKKPQYHSMIVYNPRDYDYNPMMALAKVYFNKSRPDLALPLLKGCLAIHPKDENLKSTVADMEREAKRLYKVVEASERIKGYGDDKEKILFEINKLDEDLQSHPEICRIRNTHFVKTESTGKDIAYYCGQTHHEWSGETIKTKGMGGSEEAVVNLAIQWAKLGYNVTVFNSCGVVPVEVDGVTYKPYWHYNPKDRYDYTILWRTPRLSEYDINTTKLYVDLHDVISEGEFTEKRLKKIDKIFVKTNSHRVLFPNVPDEKFAIIPNGQDFSLFTQDIQKDPYLIVNTSSPDRSMDVLPKLFKQIKKQVPQARMKWAYGFDIFDQSNKDDKRMMEWRDKVLKEMDEAGIENMGRLSQRDCAKLYLEGRILAYPSEFYEIDCISVKKAQACGCMPITTDFAAFEESVQHGIKIHSKKTKDDWSKPYQFTFGLEDETAQKKWVDAVVKELKSPMKDVTAIKEWTKKFDWKLISNTWIENFA